MNEEELIAITIEIITSSKEAVLSCIVDSLSKVVCDQLGHKIYRESVKPFKKFSTFINTHTSVFDVSEESIITLRDNDSTNTKLTEPSIDNSIIDEVNNINILNSEATTTIVEVVNEDCFTTTDTDMDRQQKNYNAVTELLSVLGNRESLLPLPEITIINGDIFENEWEVDADVVYAASLLFSEEMMCRLTRKVCGMKNGSWFVTLKPLLLVECGDVSSHVHLKEESFFKMSWQMAKVYFYKIERPLEALEK